MLKGVLIVNINELIKTSVNTLKKNGRRSFLTMIGIVIGISAVITIMSLGNGFKEYTINTLSSNTDGSYSQEFYFSPNNANEHFKLEEIFSKINQQYIRDLPEVSEVIIEDNTQELGSYLDLKIEGETLSTNTMFVDENRNLNILAGRPLNKNDSFSMKPYITVSELLLKDIYNKPEEALGEIISTEGQYFTIVGVFAQEPFLVSTTANAQAYIPSGTAERLNDGKSLGLNLKLTVLFNSKADIKKTSEDISKYLAEEGAANYKGQYIHLDTIEITEGIGNVLSTITYFISVIAGISLFIAGVGVMNMMYISVSERTKEIGIRRALGATKKNIQVQFLLEGLVVAIIGGMIGYIIGIIFASIISLFLPFNTVIDMSTALLAATISALIGIIFSVSPAAAAANKNVTEILK